MGEIHILQHHKSQEEKVIKEIFEKLKIKTKKNWEWYIILVFMNIYWMSVLYSLTAVGMKDLR